MYRTFEEKKRKITSAPPSKAPMPLSPQPPGNHHLPTPPTTDLCKPEVCIKVNLIIFLKKLQKILNYLHLQPQTSARLRCAQSVKRHLL
jgi:hypothetical protein